MSQKIQQLRNIDFPDLIEENFNLILNSVIQSAVVFIIIFLVYKFIIIQEANKIYGKIVNRLVDIGQDLIPGLKYTVHQMAGVKEKDILNRIYQIESKIEAKNKENEETNIKVFSQAGWILIFLLVLATIMIGCAYYFKIKIIWTAIIISIMMTGFGALFEYYYVKNIIVQHFMFELSDLYDKSREGFYSKMRCLIKQNGWEEELGARVVHCDHK